MIVSIESVRKRNVTDEKMGLRYRNNPGRNLPISDRTERVKRENPSIRYATSAFWNVLKDFQREGLIDLSCFPTDFDKRIRYHDYTSPGEVENQIAKLSQGQKTEAAYRIIEALHNGWLSDYREDFFCMYIDWEFLFLPIELIGVRFFKAYLNSTRRLFERFQIEVTDDDLINLYIQKRKIFLERRNVKSFQTLLEAIIQVGNDYLEFVPEIAEVLQYRRLAFDVARQVLYYSPELINSRD